MRLLSPNRSLYTVLLFGLLLGACSQRDDVFDQTPNERIQTRQDSLRQVLTSAADGWEVLYFPRTDSLLFADPKVELELHRYARQLGYGGFYYQMIFSDQGTLQLRGDYSDGSAGSYQTVHYRLGHSTMTQLSFTTGSYLTSLIGEQFEGELDFLFQGTDADGRLVFLSPKTTKPARAYLLLKRLDKDSGEARLRAATDNRRFFEQMRNPRLKIQQGGRTYFSSDYITKYSSRGDLTTYGRNHLAQRYALFTQVSRKPIVPDDPPQAIVGLGSGYVGTPEGLCFLSGIRLDSQHIFSDFQLTSNQYVCELVSVYDPLWRTTRLVSKHLHPEGEETGIKAIIYDDPNASYNYN